jgi:hypothetical protein
MLYGKTTGFTLWYGLGISRCTDMLPARLKTGHVRIHWNLASRYRVALVVKGGIGRMPPRSDPTHEHQNQDDDQDCAEPTRGVVTPASAVGPCWERRDQKNH